MPDERYLHLVRPDCPLPPGTHVVAYCRDSGGEEQDRSVQQQAQTVEEYCARHNLVLERIYADEARSSSSTEKRDALNTVLTDLASRFKQLRSLQKRQASMATHPFGLIVWKSNRLGRDSIETTYIKADLRMRGITIVNLVPTLETGDATIDALFEVVQQYQDEKLLQEISDNARRGLAELVSLRDTDPEFRRSNPDWPTNDGRYLGIMPGDLPTGFRSERVIIGMRERKGRRQGGEKHAVQRMVPNHEDGVWERCYLAWRMRHEGAPIKEILKATRLFKNVGGYTTFFKNRIYTGDLEYGGKIYENFVPALIPRQWWEQEQQRRQERAAKQAGRALDPMYEPRRVASRHLLTGLVFCGAATGEEHPMRADTVPARAGKRSRWDFYICTRKSNSRDTACKAGRVGAAALDQAVIESLMTHVLTKDNLRPLADVLAETLSERNRDVTERIAAVQGRMNEVQRGISQLVDAVEKLGFSPNLQGRLREREEEERKLLIELANLEMLLVGDSDLHIVSDQQLDEWVASIRGALEGEDRALAQQAIRQFVAKIVVHEKAGTIYYTFPLSTLSRNEAVALRGCAPSPRYYSLSFTLRRARYRRTTQPESTEKVTLKHQAVLLRQQGASLPEIARQLGISLGTAWNYTH